jgi:hypothetical protein
LSLSLRAAFFDALALTFFTQFQRYAMHRTSAGGGRATSCEPPQVLSDGSKSELILGASWATQSKPTRAVLVNIEVTRDDDLATITRLHFSEQLFG